MSKQKFLQKVKKLTKKLNHKKQRQKTKLSLKNLMYLSLSSFVVDCDDVYSVLPIWQKIISKELDKSE